MVAWNERFGEGVLKAYNSKARNAISAVLMVGAGYFGWVAPSETDSGRQCSDLRTQVTAMTADLYKKGTLGSDPCLFCPTEVRNPNDSDSLQKYGDLKNERDRVCNANKKDYWEPKAEVLLYIAFLGLFGLFLPRLSSQRKEQKF